MKPPGQTAYETACLELMMSANAALFSSLCYTVSRGKTPVFPRLTLPPAPVCHKVLILHANTA